MDIKDKEGRRKKEESRNKEKGMKRVDEMA